MIALKLKDKALNSVDKPQADQPPLDQMISYRVSKLQANLNAQAIRILKEHAGLTPTQWRVLVMITSLGQCTSADVARATQLDKGLLSRTIKGMIAGKLIETGAGRNNRRSMILRITKAGMAAYERARPFMQERHDSLMRSLSKEERSVMFAAFEKLEANIREAEADL